MIHPLYCGTLEEAANKGQVLINENPANTEKVLINRNKIQFLSKRDLLTIVSDVCRALIGVHVLNAVHGDVKSSNVLLTKQKNRVSGLLSDWDKCNREKLIETSRYFYRGQSAQYGLSSKENDCFGIAMMLGEVFFDSDFKPFLRNHALILGEQYQEMLQPYLQFSGGELNLYRAVSSLIRRCVDLDAWIWTQVKERKILDEVRAIPSTASHLRKAAVHAFLESLRPKIIEKYKENILNASTLYDEIVGILKANGIVEVTWKYVI